MTIDSQRLAVTDRVRTLSQQDQLTLLWLLVSGNPAAVALELDALAAIRSKPPSTTEAVVAESIEQQSRYRNELRHIPGDVLLARDEGGEPCGHCTLGPGHGMCQCVDYCSSDGCWGTHR